MNFSLRNITATEEESWAPSVGLVNNDIGAIDGVDVNIDEDVLDDEPNLNTYGIDDTPADLDTWDKGNKKFDLSVHCKKRKK